MEIAMIREDERRRVRESLYKGVDCAAHIRSAVEIRSPISPAKRPMQLEDSALGSGLPEWASDRFAEKLTAGRRKRTLGEALGAWSLLSSTARRQAQSINLAKAKPSKLEVTVTPLRRAAMRRGCCLELAAMGKWKELASIFSFPNGPSLLAQSDEEGCNALHM